MNPLDIVPSGSRAFNIPTLPNGKDKYFFVCYSHEDGERVLSYVEDLEQRLNLSCFYHNRDFQPGKLITQSITEFMTRSLKVILFLSPNFHESQWCMIEVGLALINSLYEGVHSVITVMLEKCEIPKTLVSFTHVDATNQDVDVAQRIASTVVQTCTADKQFNSEDKGDVLRNIILDQRFSFLNERERHSLIDIYSRKENLIGRGSYGKVYSDAADKQWNSEDNDDNLRNTIFDGRSILLKEKEKDSLIEICSRKENLIGLGSYGKVYSVTGKDKLQRLKRDLAVKKVRNNQKSVRKEMIVSRILNPFIVPLLAWFRQDENTTYFVYPFFEKKDLYGVLRECRDSDEARQSFNAVRRLRVCLQMGYALVYLHTPVRNVREPILHKDVCSQNILLDKNYNARLTDFGMAREENDTTTTASARTTYSHPDVGKGENSMASKSWDCFAFGVVLREVLTELDPHGVNNTHLKYMEPSVVLTLAKDISTDTGTVWPPDIAETVCEVSSRCLALKTDITENFAEEVKILKQTFNQTGCNVMERENVQTSDLDSQTKCDVCMFNKPALRLQQRICEDSCAQSIQVCMPCEKHSFLNPLTCYTCGCRLKREIGDKCKAILVAGPDSDGNVMEAFNKDVESVKRVLISKAPMIIGMSKEDIVEIYSDEGSIAQRIMMTLEEIKDKEINTLLIYMSCHGQKNAVVNEGNGHSLTNHKHQSMKEQRRETGNDNSKQVDRRHLLDKNNGLVDKAEYENKYLDKDQNLHTQEDNKPQTNAIDSHSFLLGKETLSFDEFETVLGKLRHIKNFVIILDMCHAPKLNIENKNVLQINSCAADQKSRSVSCGSTFTRLLIQGLKGASEKSNCCLKQSNECSLCQRFFRRNDEFTTVENLFRYISDHMEVDRDNVEYPQKPKLYVATDTVNIAYNTDQPVLIEFHVEIREGEVKKRRKIVEIGLEYFTDLAPIQKSLFEEFGRDENKEKMTIKANRYRADVTEVECDSLEKVMAAWVNRDQLFVEFEQTTSEH